MKGRQPEARQTKIERVKVRQVGDNVIIEKPISTSDMIERFHQRIFRDQRRGSPPKSKRMRRKILSQEIVERRRRRESKREKALRQSRLRAGLCAECGRERGEVFKLCDRCRTRHRFHNERYRIKQTILESYGDL